MRARITMLAIALTVWSAPAMAFENFIPLGHNYSPDDQHLPAFNSPEDVLNSQVDIFETEIYTRQRIAKEFNSRLTQFSNEQELKGTSDFIDY